MVNLNFVSRISFLSIAAVMLLGVTKMTVAANATQAFEQLKFLQGKIDQQKQKNSVSTASQGDKLPQSGASSASTEETKVQTDEEAINKQAFDEVKSKMFPLTHEQTLDLHKKYNEQQYSLSTTPGTPPRPAVTTQMVRLDPGSTPSVIRLGQGFISSVVFLDSTGAPWPIVAYDLGDPASFNIQWDKAGNILMIQSKKLYTYGNMAIKLQDLNTPIMLTLVPGQQVIDYRVDMRVQGYGPNAKDLPMGESLPASANDELLHVLDDIPPLGSKPLKVKGGPAKAWAVGNTMFVRTTLTLLSPGWVSMMTSADGTHAYQMTSAPILLVSWHGKVMQLKIEGL